VGALDGLRVIDFGHYIAGPLAAVMLADQGADVIHVDPPNGPAWNTDADAFLQRGKRRISLDLKSAPDRETARRLVDSADVLIENFRPGVMDRLGLGAEAATERNPRLVYCSIPGFAPDDPRAGMQGWEGILDAATDNCIRGAGAFRCKDDKYVQFDTSSARHLVWFAQEADITEWGPELLDIMRLRDERVNQQLHARLRELFLTRTAHEWEEIGNRAGAACAW